MGLARFVQPLDFSAIFDHLFLMLRLFGAILLPPLLLSLAVREFLFSFIIGLLAAATMVAGTVFGAKQPADLGVKEALAVTALAYLQFSLLGAVVFIPVAPYIDGFFEAMSGFTTTGLGVLNLEHLPATLLFFRAYSQWIGGVGIVFFSLMLLVGPGKTAFQLYASEFGEEKLTGNSRATARLVLKVYLTLSAACYVAYLAVGMAPYDALLVVMATLSTGGFSPHGASIGYYHSPSVTVVVACFMFLGAVGFPSYYLSLHRGWKRLFRDDQLRYLLFLILASTILFTAAWDWRIGSALPSLFNAVSAVTTTGFGVGAPRLWPDAEKFAAILLMIAGGAAGSTAGGIKLFRVIVLIRTVRSILIRTLLPEEARAPIKYAEGVVGDRETMRIFGFAGAYLLILCASSLLLVLAGFPIVDSFFECASAIGTVGLSTGITNRQLPAWIKSLLIFDMWAGRLEILPILVVFYYRLWMPKRRKA